MFVHIDYEVIIICWDFFVGSFLPLLPYIVSEFRLPNDWYKYLSMICFAAYI
jgi:hypothetical protein